MACKRSSVFASGVMTTTISSTGKWTADHSVNTAGGFIGPQRPRFSFPPEPILTWEEHVDFPESRLGRHRAVHGILNVVSAVERPETFRSFGLRSFWAFWTHQLLKTGNNICFGED